MSVRLGQLSEVTQLNRLSREAVHRFYTIAEPALLGVDPKNVWVVDESGIAARGAQVKVSHMSSLISARWPYSSH